jgi:hypothetical protein
VRNAACAQVVASVLQLQALAAEHAKRAQPLAVVAAISHADTEDVLWHAVLSHHAELRAEAAARAAAVVAARGTGKGASKAAQELLTPAGAGQLAAALLGPPVSLHLLRPAALLSGMLTQVSCLAGACACMRHAMRPAALTGRCEGPKHHPPPHTLENTHTGCKRPAAGARV